MDRATRRRRSLSPHDQQHADAKSRRERSPHHSRRHKHDYDSKVISLPYGRQAIDKNDFHAYRDLFSEYLRVQKGLDITHVPDDEVKGRWKSFIGKWNRAELSDSWYAVPTRRVADSSEAEEDDDLGPALPPSHSSINRAPAVPSLQDLQYRDELKLDDQAQLRSQLQYDRKVERKLEKERAEDMVPRAAPGSRERQLEKKRDAAQSNKAFAEARDSGAVEVLDSDLMGDDSIDAYKAKIKAQQRQKNEREIRKEELLRARAAEREERLAEHRRKEDKTMQTLRALAEQRYGKVT